MDNGANRDGCMNTKKILVACTPLDYILILKVLGENFILDQAQSREEIIRLRKEHHYDLLLIDIVFLKPDFKVISGMSEMNIPVIALSSEPFDAREGRLQKAGCCACYVRPIRVELFAAFVTYWIEEYARK